METGAGWLAKGAVDCANETTVWRGCQFHFLVTGLNDRHTLEDSATDRTLREAERCMGAYSFSSGMGGMGGFAGPSGPMRIPSGSWPIVGVLRELDGILGEFTAAAEVETDAYLGEAVYDVNTDGRLGCVETEGKERDADEEVYGFEANAAEAEGFCLV